MMNEPNPMMNLSLVIPCYNESDRIGLLYKGIEDFMTQWKHDVEVIIVNDGSKDDTLTKLKEHEVFSKYTNRIVIQTQENTGKGGALQNGVLKATGNYILTLDADMASPPTEVIKWLDGLNGQFAENTIYIGSREHKASIIRNQGDRKMAGNIFNWIVRTLTSLHIKDTQCGFKLYPAKVAKKYFSELGTLGWAHDVEILYRANMDKVNIIEMPLEWNAIEGSKINVVRDGFNMLIETMNIVIKNEFKK